MNSAMIIDIETTGLEPSKDKIIEVGFLEFVFGSDLKPAIINIYGGLDDPGFDLAPEISSLTGIQSYQLKDRRVDWDIINQAVARSKVLIAHNAAFDRSFLEQREEFSGQDVHWACSMSHIDWQNKGFKTRSLNYLAADSGFVNPFAHRAVFDCATTFRLIAPHINELIERSFEKEYHVLAVGAPFESKDKLKNCGYRWDPGQRVWSKIVAHSKLDLEREFLETVVYSGASKHIEKEL